MNRFSRIRHHVDMRDVKEKCLHEIAMKKIKEEKDRKERNIIQEISKKYKSNWRDELDEGMTVAGFMKTVVPSEGDKALVNNDTKSINDGTVPYPLNPPDANALPGVSAIFAPGPANVIDPNGKGGMEGVPYGAGTFGGGFGGGQIWASNTDPYGSRDSGTIENSGFDMGGPYARLYSEVGGPIYGTIPYRYVTLSSTDTTELSHLRITAIQGNNTQEALANGGNGGWDINGAREQASIRVRYWVPGMSDFQYLSINPQGQTTRGQFDQDPSSDGYQLNPTDVIVPYDANASFPTNFLIELPEYARGKDVRFQLYQKQTMPYGFTYGQHWGVSNISYQRRTPISVVVSLDSPEATSFIRVGQGTKKSSPKKRKKRVEDILSAGKEYTNKYLGSDFPGSSTELSPETSPEVSSIDQEIADIQQQSRDSMSQQTKDRFEKTPDEGTFDADGNYIPPGFENAIGTDEIGKPEFDPFKDEIKPDLGAEDGDDLALLDDPGGSILAAIAALGLVIKGGQTIMDVYKKYKNKIDKKIKEMEALGSVSQYTGGDATAAATAAASTNIASAGVNYDLYNWYVKTYGSGAAGWYHQNPGSDPSNNPFLRPGSYVPKAQKNGKSSTMVAHFVPRGKNLSEVMFVKKTKIQRPKQFFQEPNQFFNVNDIKPEFPENPPPKLDPNTGMHPEYGKKAKRYRKLDPISANSMPPTGDPEIDAVVNKQKTIKKIKKMAKNK